MLKKYIYIFLISMVPLIELRGAVPVSQVMGLPIVPSFIVCIIANMLPVPIIYLFARKVLIWGADKPVIGRFFSFCLEKGEKGGKKLQAKAGRGLFVALLLFVGIPLPGTVSDICRKRSLLIFESSTKVTLEVNPNVFSNKNNKG